MMENRQTGEEGHEGVQQPEALVQAGQQGAAGRLAGRAFRPHHWLDVLLQLTFSNMT